MQNNSKVVEQTSKTAVGSGRALNPSVKYWGVSIESHHCYLIFLAQLHYTEDADGGHWVEDFHRV